MPPNRYVFSMRESLPLYILPTMVVFEPVTLVGVYTLCLTRSQAVSGLLKCRFSVARHVNVLWAITPELARESTADTESDVVKQVKKHT